MKRRLLDAYRLTPTGGASIFVLVAALLVLLLGPHHDEAPALIVILITLVFILSAVLGGPNMRGAAAKSIEERREEFRPSRPRVGEPAQAEADESAWQRERALREQAEARRAEAGDERG